jgi:hypothetical protein
MATIRDIPVPKPAAAAASEAPMAWEEARSTLSDVR